MKKWEYAVVPLKPEEFTDSLVEFGEKGWELVYPINNPIEHNWKCVFKREIEPEPEVIEISHQPRPELGE